MDPDEAAAQALDLENEIKQNIASSLVPLCTTSRSTNDDVDPSSDGVCIETEPHFHGTHVSNTEAEYLRTSFGVIAAGFHIYNVRCLVCLSLVYIVGLQEIDRIRSVDLNRTQSRSSKVESVLAKYLPISSDKSPNHIDLAASISKCKVC